MSQVLGYLVLAGVAALITYRHICQIRYEAACRRAQQPRLRLVHSRKAS